MRFRRWSRAASAVTLRLNFLRLAIRVGSIGVARAGVISVGKIPAPCLTCDYT